MPILAQLLLIEFIIDGLKLASLNTPSVLSNSFSVVGRSYWEILQYRPSGLCQRLYSLWHLLQLQTLPNRALNWGYAFKLFRVVILVLTALFNIWGYIAGLLLMLLILICSKTISGRGYLYPLLPFNAQAFSRLLVRRRINNRNT